MSMEHPSTPSHATAHGTARGAGVGHEERDVSFAPIVRGLVALIALLLFSCLVTWLFFRFLAVREARTSPPPNPLAHSFGRQLPPEPRLQPDPLLDLETMRAQEDAILHSYGWVDRKAGIVRIPIDRALELLAQRGLPARPPGGTP